MLWGFSILYWAFFCLSLPLGFAGALLVYLVTFPFDRHQRALHRYTCAWGMFYIAANPIWSVRVTGRDKILRRGAAVIVANHASLIDILVLFGLYRQFKWVSKASNFKLPIIGWLMRLNRYVHLVRGDRASVIAMMNRCRELLGQRIPVLIFPEGTRSATKGLQGFKDGAFTLAMESGAPVIPIAVHGTGEALPKHGLILRRRMDAHVEVLDPIDPARFGSVQELRDATHRALSAALGFEEVAAEPARELRAL
ncbi:MAG: lysophospholipid acyltransferase family protein [Actinomycetota bacterium]